MRSRREQHKEKMPKITVTLEPGQLGQIEDVARDFSEKNVSYIVRQAIDCYLDHLARGGHPIFQKV